jgi:hypothetical protein
MVWCVIADHVSEHKLLLHIALRFSAQVANPNKTTAAAAAVAAAAAAAAALATIVNRSSSILVRVYESLNDV